MIVEALTPGKEPVRSGPASPPQVFEQPVRKVKEERQEEQKKLTEEKASVDAFDAELLKDVLEAVENSAAVRNRGLEFSVHDATGRMRVTVVDKETNEVVREIPSEKLLDLLGKMDEMVGILFDVKA